MIDRGPTLHSTWHDTLLFDISLIQALSTTSRPLLKCTYVQKGNKLKQKQGSLGVEDFRGIKTKFTGSVNSCLLVWLLFFLPYCHKLENILGRVLLLPEFWNCFQGILS